MTLRVTRRPWVRRWPRPAATGRGGAHRAARGLQDVEQDPKAGSGEALQLIFGDADEIQKRCATCSMAHVCGVAPTVDRIARAQPQDVDRGWPGPGSSGRRSGLRLLCNVRGGNAGRGRCGVPRPHRRRAPCSVGGQARSGRRVGTSAPATSRCWPHGRDGRYESFMRRSRSALPITDTELRLIAAAASIGLSRIPNAGYRTPAAIGTPRTL